MVIAVFQMSACHAKLAAGSKAKLTCAHKDSLCGSTDRHVMKNEKVLCSCCSGIGTSKDLNRPNVWCFNVLLFSTLMANLSSTNEVKSMHIKKGICADSVCATYTSDPGVATDTYSPKSGIRTSNSSRILKSSIAQLARACGC